MAAAKGIFVGLSLEQVLKIQLSCVTAIEGGKTIMSYQDGGGISVQKAWPIDPQTVLLECRHALKVLDPTTYGSIRNTRRCHSNFHASTEL